MICPRCGNELSFTGNTLLVGQVDEENELDVWRCGKCSEEVEVAARNYPGLYELMQAERRSLDAYDPQDYYEYDDEHQPDENEDE